MSIPENIRMIARKLRNNMTDSEKIIWDKLRRNKFGYRILRQKPFYVYTENSGLDRYVIPDFYIASKKLLIEIDGQIHNLPEILVLDKVKEKLIFERGFTILRITNNEIFNNLGNVLNIIEEKLK